MKIWVDDERPAPDETWTLAENSIEACFILAAAHALIDRAAIQEISLDHDLGGDDTGMKVLDFMIEHSIWPKVLTIHTSNPPARGQMLRAANAEAPASTEIFIRYW
jgi:hypothetical protein